MSKLRVWWIPQVGIEETFYVPVSSPEDGYKIMNILSAYDAFQLQNKVKPDYCNVGGLQMWDEEENDWCDWYLEVDDDYYEDVDEYCESKDCLEKEHLEIEKEEIFSQVEWDRIHRMTD